MSIDYKSHTGLHKPAKAGNPLITGLLIGFLLGVAASLSVVMFIKGGESPFTHQSPTEKSVADKIVDKTDVKADLASARSADGVSANTEEKTRFDFYNILPGSESKVSPEEENTLKGSVQQPGIQQSYFLQVGAFQTGEEADNMKAKLALQGFEALVQTTTIPEKGVWHRVRMGPLKDLEQINKIKKDLLANGFKADLINVNNENQ